MHMPNCHGTSLMPPLLRVEGLHFAYPGEPALLCNACFSLDAGQKLGLLGDNAAGKSTLFHLITGLLAPTAGTVALHGTPCTTNAHVAAVRRTVGYLLQNSDEQLFCESVLEDVAFAPQNYGLPPAQAVEKAQQALEACGIAHLQDKSVYALSGGEKKLVALAGILAQEPEALLLDEPTNMLDTRTRQRLIDILHTLPQAMLVVSHDTPFLHALCSGFLSLENGQTTTMPPFHQHQLA
ncbi:energy-coupling factor ABC transporter ATP-binding protein [Desulfovibrio cuneatus]|uniref:energy-coupling factor ABC transporter ATP-binding protein n=1 Tax=Desulfovibrio cuneatus TaxID=159728 RepID=UPI0004076672|nr:ABC transporter ATP-binding protein [Desulfovibrio cuneatus]